MHVMNFFTWLPRFPVCIIEKLGMRVGLPYFSMYTCVQEKSGRPGRSGDVIRHGLRHGCVFPLTRPRMIHHATNYVGEWVEIHKCSSNCIRLHHQINLAFPIFLTYVEKHEKAWLRGYTKYTLLYDVIEVHQHQKNPCFLLLCNHNVSPFN